MAGDLERFLQEAAERLAQKVNQGQRGPKRPAPRRSVRQAERAPIDPEVVDAEIVEAQLVTPHNPRELGPDPLSNIDTRPALAQGISQADEKMADHVHGALDHELMHLKDASKALEADRAPGAGDASQVQQRKRMVSPLIAMLRNPETLRAAFLASEIFRRKV